MKNPTIIIAEAGVNHNGELEKALQLVDIAAACNVDYVKFQTFITEYVVDKNIRKADYQQSNSPTENTQYEMIKKLELSISDYAQIKEYCQEKGVGFLTTPADHITLDQLDSFNLDYIKIASGDLTNLQMIKKAALKKKPLIISTGMATINEIKDAISICTEAGVSKDDITLLHCNTEYPTPLSDVNILAMLDLKSVFNVKTGYSDHTTGIEASLAAVTLGASVIEKHFTIDKALPGPDHLVSLSPEELKDFVLKIRNIEECLAGDGKKKPTPSESKNISIVRKRIMALKDIQAHEEFNMENLIAIRSQQGVDAKEYPKIEGRKSTRTIKEGEFIELNDISW